MELFGTAFFLGLMGSGHCLGMCGGFALAVAQGKEYRRHLLGYQLGRALTYITLGAMVALIGTGLSKAVSQRWVMFGAGTFMMVLGMGLVSPRSLLPTGWVARSGGKWIKERRFEGSVLLGVANGFLPCGLLYAGLAYAALASNPIFGGLVMFGFWLGTVPALSGLALAGFKISPRLSAFTTFFLGAFLAYRSYFMAAGASCH
ncbi:MAG: sulfite exporter TauE/SafE family protein [Candidatus Eremiobacteraeota bacterium]|nr:sulfite exporter TauE/SafE family protein [Candidatus Eremiobacteraeota bacterium]